MFIFTPNCTYKEHCVCAPYKKIWKINKLAAYALEMILGSTFHVAYSLALSFSLSLWSWTWATNLWNLKTVACIAYYRFHITQNTHKWNIKRIEKETHRAKESIARQIMIKKAKKKKKTNGVAADTKWLSTIYLLKANWKSNEHTTKLKWK